MAPAIDSRVFSLIQDNSKAEKKSKFIEQCCRAHGPFDMISSSVCLNVNIIQRRSRKHFTMEDNVFSFFFHLQTTKNTMNISTDRKIFTQNNRRNKNFLQEKKWSDVEWKKKKWYSWLLFSSCCYKRFANFLRCFSFEWQMIFFVTLCSNSNFTHKWIDEYHIKVSNRIEWLKCN